MSFKKIAIATFIILLLCAASICGALYFASTMLIKYLHFADIHPSITLPFQVAHFTNKKIQGFGAIATALSIGLPVLVWGFMFYALVMPKKRELHGSAKFATEVELLKSGLLTPDTPQDQFPSIIIGKRKNKYLLFRGQQSAFLAAPTRSGKGVGVVIPNCLHFRDSMVVLDVKGENYAITAGFRQSCGQEIHCFAPDDETGKTAQWNPLTYVRTDKRLRVSDLLSITNILYPPSEDVWSSTAENLFLGLALYIMDTSKEQGKLNISTIKRYSVTLDFLKDEDTFIKYVESRKELEPLSEDTITHLRSYAQTTEKLRNSILVTFNQPLAIFADPITAHSTSTSTFDFRDVRKKRMSIYVVIKPKNLGKFGLFLNLFFEQLITQNLETLPQDDASLKYQCLMLLDEFAAIGRINIIEKASAYMAGYNMRLLLIFQSKSQLKDRKLYDTTGAETLLTNMALQVVYAPRDDDDAKDYSEMLGYLTEKGKSKSRQLSGRSGSSESVSDQRRALLLPQEIKAIGIDKEIVSLENMTPALVDKIFWYKDPIFQARGNMPIKTYTLAIENPLENTIEPLLDDSLTINFGGAVRTQELSAGAIFEVGFAPRRNALEVVMSLILLAQKELLICAHNITNREIAYALVEASKRGVDVRIAVHHNSFNTNDYNPLEYIQAQNVPVFKITNYAEMQHKFMVADELHVQLGSYDYTNESNNANAENAIVFRNAKEIAEVYRTEWIRLTTEPKADIKDIIAIDKGLEALKAMGVF